MIKTLHTAVCATLLSAALAAPATAAGIPQVQHVVIIYQENRTPDNLFHGLKSYLPKADIANVGVNSKGEKITLTPVPLAGPYDLNHYHIAFEQMYDNGKMDGADKVHCAPPANGTCPANPQFAYVKPTDVAPYRFMATHWGFANRMFQGNQGPSFPAHLYIIGATSQISTDSIYFAADNPNNAHSIEGCTGIGQEVPLIGPNKKEDKKMPPCFEHQTLMDLIDRPPASARQGLSWRYYAPRGSIIWNAPYAIKHICKPVGNPPKCTGAAFTNGSIASSQTQILKDIPAGKLPSVSWVIPTGFASDHARDTDGTGPSWVASIVNAIGKSKYWNNTVILVTWDDWGGWYDHVKPPTASRYSYYEMGFRVPLLVISPYTQQGYVSNETHSFGSVLRFVEKAFGLPLIFPGHYLDSRSDALGDFFNFKAKPRKFTPVPAPKTAKFFLDDKRPANAPDDDETSKDPADKDD